jgi:multicomponent Na+:H+ antiporter subunit E
LVEFLRFQADSRLIFDKSHRLPYKPSLYPVENDFGKIWAYRNLPGRCPFRGRFARKIAMPHEPNNADEAPESSGRIARLVPFFLAASVLVWLALTAGRGLLSIPAALTVVGGGIAGTWAYRRRTPPVRPLPLAKLAVFFLHQSVVSGLDVARRAFSPGPDIDPGLVDYETRLERESARILFANLMSLLPGTLCCRLDGRKLRVHALCRKQPVQESLALLESKIHDALR